MCFLTHLDIIKTLAREGRWQEIDRLETTWREIPWFEQGEWYETEWPCYVVWIKHDWRAITESRAEAERAAASHPTGRFRGFCRHAEARRAWSSSYDLKVWSMSPRNMGLPKLSDINDLPSCATPPSGSTPESPVNLVETEESSSNREVAHKDPTPKDSTSRPLKTPTGVMRRPATNRALRSPPESPISLTSQSPPPSEGIMPDWWPWTLEEETGESSRDRESTPQDRTPSDPAPEDPAPERQNRSNRRRGNGGNRRHGNRGNGRQRRVNSSSAPVFSQSSTPATSNIWHREEGINSSPAPVFSQPSTSTSSSQRPGRPKKILSPTRTSSLLAHRLLSQPPTSTSSNAPPATSLDIRGRPMTSASSPALPPSQDTPLMSPSIREASPSKRARTDDSGDHYSHVEKPYDCKDMDEAVAVLRGVYGDGNSRSVRISLLM